MRNIFLLVILATATAFGDVQRTNGHGQVVMEDGSPLPKPAGIQKICTDGLGSSPGPLTDKDGSYLWTRMEFDFLAMRKCFLEASIPGYESTRIDISNVNPTNTTTELPVIKLSLKGGDPMTLGGDEHDVPGNLRNDFANALKLINAGNIPGAMAAFQKMVAANPQFALGWQNIGILLETQGERDKAREAYTKAVNGTPKLLAAHVTLVRTLVYTKDWDGLNKIATAGEALDKNRIFPELYLNQAVARYNLKDLPGAEAAANEALSAKNKRRSIRAEYVLGRILEAKGDKAAAKDHMEKYLTLDPMTPDVDIIRAHLAQLGQADAPEPPLVLIAQ